MTNDKREYIEKLFDSLSENKPCDAFDLIPVGERLHPSRRLCGYLKLASVLANPASFDVCADHDIVWAAEIDELRDDVSDEDIQYLSYCGFFVDSETGSLAHFC